MGRMGKGMRALLGGLWTTFRHVFRRPITLRYPEQRRAPAPGYRGVPALRRHPDGSERCVACALCAQICPARCIEMTTDTGPDGRKRPLTYRLDVGRCLFCGLCAEVCPVEAIVMSPRYELTFRDHRQSSLSKEWLLDNGKGL